MYRQNMCYFEMNIAKYVTIISTLHAKIIWAYRSFIITEESIVCALLCSMHFSPVKCILQLFLFRNNY